MSNTTGTTTLSEFLKSASQALHDVSKRSPLVKLNDKKSVLFKPRQAIKTEIENILALDAGAPSAGVRDHRDDYSIMSILNADTAESIAILKSLESIAKDKMRQKGFPTIHISFGLCHSNKVDINAPLILIPVVLKSNKEKNEFRIERHGDPEVNPALQRILSEEASLSNISEHVRNIEAYSSENTNAETVRNISNAAELSACLHTLKTLTKQIIPDAQIDINDIRVANFTFSNDIIIRDIDTIEHLISDENQSINRGCLTKLYDKSLPNIQPNIWSRITTMFTAPTSETSNNHKQQYDQMTPYLILSSDSSQRQVIADALNGKSLCVQGPPGTGKSQTIANLIATLIANKKRVLFIAEKQTAINAVTKNLSHLKGLYIEIEPNTSLKKLTADEKEINILCNVNIDTHEAHANFHAWQAYLERSSTLATTLRKRLFRAVNGEQKTITQLMNDVFTPSNANVTLFWHTHLDSVVRHFSFSHIGIWGFWKLWGYWYMRLFLNDSVLAATYNKLKNLPTSSQPEVLIKSLPIGLCGLVRHIVNNQTSINIADIVNYHLQRLFVERYFAKIKSTLETLQNNLNQLPAWGRTYINQEGNNRHQATNQHAVNLVKAPHMRAQSKAEEISKQPASTKNKDTIPCVITTPKELIRFFTPTSPKFDVVIIDEASQLRPESAIGAFFRANQYVVFGDKKQLPPTSFGVADMEDIDEMPNSLKEFYTTTGESTLEWAEKASDRAAKKANKEPDPMLTFFYRGSEQLISASNKHFYNGNIKSFPRAQGSSVTHHMITAHGEKSAIDNQIYTKVIEIYTKAAKVNKSVKIIASSLERKRSLESYAKKTIPNASLDNVLTSIEQVQGDQAACVIFFFDHPDIRQDGNINLIKLGPINNNGGERRLNVAFTRATEEMHIVTSFSASQISATQLNPAQEFLKEYLQMAGQNKNNQLVTASQAQVQDWEQHFAKVLHHSVKTVSVSHSYGMSGQPITWVTQSKDNDFMISAFDTDLGRFSHEKFDIRDELIRREQLKLFKWKGIEDLIDADKCLTDIESVKRIITNDA